MTARILILQESASEFRPLQKSLSGHHELVFVDSVRKAWGVLKTSKPDMIISRVHLQRGDVFDFLRSVRRDPSTAACPVILFSGLLNPRALALDEVLAKSALFLGADKYLKLSDFYTGESFDFSALRQEIEECLRGALNGAL